MGLVEKSSVTAYLEEYYEKHPLDNSYEGILARRSGLTKEQVVAYLDKLDYFAKVVDYDPTNKAPILKQEAQKPYRFHVDSEDNAEYILGVNNYYIKTLQCRKIPSQIGWVFKLLLRDHIAVMCLP